MKRVSIKLALLGALLVPQAAFAQETCTDEQKALLAACNTQCEATCSATYPGCTPVPITLDELRAAIAAECNCDESRNYGKYRSCVSHVVNALKKFALIDDATKAAIEADNKACKDSIKERTGNKGGGKGGGKKKKE